MISTVLYLLAQICSITQGVVLVYCVMTWFMSPASRLMQLLSDVVEPMLMPIRRVMLRISGMSRLDFSPFVLLFLLRLAQSLLLRLMWML